MKANASVANTLCIRFSRGILILCAVYFFLMGTGLILFPRLLIERISNAAANPIMVGMFRGAGGSILPYALLYILIWQDPLKRLWALPVILFANITAITLDVVSLVLSEYKLAYVMYDIPVELLSIIGLWMIGSKKTQPDK